MTLLDFNRASDLSDYPEDFFNWSAEDRNRYFAEGARNFRQRKQREAAHA